MSTNPKTLTITETHQLLASFVPKIGTHKQFVNGIRNKCMAMIMLEAGLRVGELVQLHISDLWFNSTPVESIIIPSEIAKNDHERTIPISTRLSESLKEMWVHNWGPNCGLGEEFAFCRQEYKTHLTTRQVERIIRRASRIAFGRWIHPHVLRHTFASKLMRKTNIRIVQELLGHSSIVSTQVYTHPNNQDLKEAINC